MNNQLIKEPKSRAKVSASFLARAVQNFADVQAHNDLTMTELLEVRRIPNAKHCMSNSQSRYVF